MNRVPSIRLSAAATVTVVLGTALVAPVALAAPASATAAGYSVTGTVAVGLSPLGVAVDPSTHRVYVANNQGGYPSPSESVIDGTTTTVVSTFSHVSLTADAAVDPSTHTVYMGKVYGIAAIDGASNTIIGDNGFRNYVGAIAVDPTTHTVYGVDLFDASLAVIDGTTNTRTKTISVGGGQAGGVAVDPTTHTVYFARTSTSELFVINGSTNTVTSTIKLPSGPGQVAVDPTSHKVFVASPRARILSVIDGTTNTLLPTIQVGTGVQGLAVDPSAHTVYAANPTTNTVAVIDGSRDAVVASVPVGSGPQRVAVDSSNHIAYVTNSDDNTVSVISPAAPPTVTSVSPTSGSTAGGQTVTVTGTGFTAPATVKFGTIPGTAVTVTSATSLTVTTPSHAAGQFHVLVTSASGTNAATTADVFTFVKVKPTLTTTVSDATTVGGAVSVSATVTGVAPSGTVTFRLYAPGSAGCTGTPLTSQAVALTTGSATAGPVTVTQAGTYRWRAVYGGDSRNLAATGACVPVRVTP